MYAAPHSKSSLLTCQAITIIHSKNIVPTIKNENAAFQSMHSPFVSSHASVAWLGPEDGL